MNRLLLSLKQSPYFSFLVGAGAILDISGNYFGRVNIPVHRPDDHESIRKDFEAVEQGIARSFHSLHNNPQKSMYDSVQERTRSIIARFE